MSLDWQTIDWQIVDRLRGQFLGGQGGGDYWATGSDLATYDHTFARRIAWKWQYVLGELAQLGWSPPAGDVLDWGCGTGTAARSFLTSYPAAAGGGRVLLHDRSALAREYAAAAMRREQPGVSGEAVSYARPAATMLISHVVTELGEQQFDSLVASAAAAQAVVWVEPGSHQASRRLLEARRRLVGEFNAVAPCTHQGACGLLDESNQRHWCHFFASTPPEVFTDGDWARFARRSGIDLRSLPVSYIVLDRRPVASPGADALRIIGRGRLYKAYAMLFACDESGVRDRRLMKRHCGEAFRRLKQHKHAALSRVSMHGDDIKSIEF